jgi:hypothetical protein
VHTYGIKEVLNRGLKYTGEFVIKSPDYFFSATIPYFFSLKNLVFFIVFIYETLLQVFAKSSKFSFNPEWRKSEELGEAATGVENSLTRQQRQIGGQDCHTKT